MSSLDHYYLELGQWLHTSQPFEVPYRNDQEKVGRGRGASYHYHTVAGKSGPAGSQHEAEQGRGKDSGE